MFFDNKDRKKKEDKWIYEFDETVENPEEVFDSDL